MKKVLKQIRILVLLTLGILFFCAVLFITPYKTARAFDGNATKSLNNEIVPLATEDSQALNSSLTTYPTYLEAYYGGLTQNFGHNYKNSCGYVALGMLLSY